METGNDVTDAQLSRAINQHPPPSHKDHFHSFSGLKMEYSSNIAFVYMDGWAEIIHCEKGNANNMIICCCIRSTHTCQYCLSETKYLIDYFHLQRSIK